MEKIKVLENLSCKKYCVNAKDVQIILNAKDTCVHVTCLLSMDEDLKCKGVQIEKKRTLSDHRRDDKNNLGVKFSTDS